MSKRVSSKFWVSLVFDGSIGGIYGAVRKIRTLYHNLRDSTDVYSARNTHGTSFCSKQAQDVSEISRGIWTHTLSRSKGGALSMAR